MNTYNLCLYCNYVCIHARSYVCMFVYVCIDVHIYVCMNVYQCVYLHLYAYNYVYVCSGFTDILATLQKHNDSYKVSHMELYGQFL